MTVIKTFSMIFCLLIPLISVAKSDSPHNVASSTVTELKLAMTRHSDTHTEGYEDIIAEVLIDKVDFEVVLKYVMGKQYYLSASEKQIEQFEKVFRNDLISTYSRGLAVFKSIDIEVLPPRMGESDKSIQGVILLLKTPEGIFPMRFTMRRDKNNQWKIINVVFNGYNVGKAYHTRFMDSMEKTSGNLNVVISDWNTGSSRSETDARIAQVESPVEGWEEIVFKGKTRYAKTDTCISALSNGSASGLIKKHEVLVDEETVLSWQWKADKAMELPVDVLEKSKEGDDFLARIFVIHEGRLPWQSKAINYVWSRENDVDETWINPVVKNAKMVVVQKGEQGLGQWHQFERNIFEDFKKYFDLEVEKVDAVALMTDTDNTGGRAEVCYKLPLVQKSTLARR